MAEEKIHYLMVEGFVSDVSLGRTTDNLEAGEFVEIDGKVYFVAGVSSDSWQYHEIYVHKNLKFDVKFYADRNPETSKRVAEFLKNPEKFNVKKVKLIEE